MLVWMLRQVIAKKEIWTGAELARLLKERANYNLSAASISALLTSQPRQMKSDTLDALCTTLECTPNDLWVYVPPQNVKGA
ncbi:helix-turn-helix domain-containing protein [Paenibacillus endoradicis]|uniref:helix-turn-helix domain-containing protein n=1 Tax=Paenibacillus endoradicis TaxID=2972487 RepID=UPI0021595825|nr:helix-turn-helix transcriptional regulator [Paenibacillus endoradicis]MCR8655826.1 helix-turn-helix transcriptional regulator [Paenibacillus endoradicis]MCR8658152.1 helix-turn-helix transcriptional regulator [Paenibacillus endoradicis]